MYLRRHDTLTRTTTASATAGPTARPSTVGTARTVQALTDRTGELLWISPALPGRTHGPTAARAPVERGMARLKSWQTFRRSRISPNRMTVITKAVLTLERQR